MICSSRILAVLVIAGALVVSSATSQQLQNAQKTGEKPNKELPSLDDLLRDYRALGLPIPAKEARLVRYGHMVGLEPKYYGLAFEIKPGTQKEKPVLLCGILPWQPMWDPIPQEVKPEPAAIKDIFWGNGLNGPTGSANDTLAIAIQCHERGWNNLAEYVFERGQKNAQDSPQQQLIRLAWSYWERQLIQPNIDRAPMAKRLKDLIAKDKALDTERNKALLRSLDLALVPSAAKRGSIEALIDDLVDYNTNTGSLWRGYPEDRFRRIAKLGFEAVPALIAHLDDDRLTRAQMEGFNNFHAWNLRVQHIVSDLLQAISGKDLGQNWLERQQGYPVEKAAAQKWWESVKGKS